MSDPSKELQACEAGSPLVIMWFETKLGVRYVMPDMMPSYVTNAHHNLDAADGDQYVHVRNVSGVLFSIPKRIIHQAGVGDRCFWESK